VQDLLENHPSNECHHKEQTQDIVQFELHLLHLRARFHVNMIHHYKVHNHHHHHHHHHHSKASTKKQCTNAPTTFQQENPWHPHCFPSPLHHKTLLDATAAKKLFVVATVVVGLLARERERH
jgi:hypothetical protein